MIIHSHEVDYLGKSVDQENCPTLIFRKFKGLKGLAYLMDFNVKEGKNNGKID